MATSSQTIVCVSFKSNNNKRGSHIVTMSEQDAKKYIQLLEQTKNEDPNICEISSHPTHPIYSLENAIKDLTVNLPPKTAMTLNSLYTQ